jgi:hypothetical protein
MVVGIESGGSKIQQHSYGHLNPMDATNKGMDRSDISKPALIFFPLQEYTQQNPLAKF